MGIEIASHPNDHWLSHLLGICDCWNMGVKELRLFCSVDIDSTFKAFNYACFFFVFFFWKSFIMLVETCPLSLFAKKRAKNRKVLNVQQHNLKGGKSGMFAL